MAIRGPFAIVQAPAPTFFCLWDALCIDSKGILTLLFGKVV